nr:MAG TPA: Hypothetical protein [Caudoviricetes sp.]
MKSKEMTIEDYQNRILELEKSHNTYEEVVDSFCHEI